MRGSPLRQLLAVVAVFALAGIPVWRLTRTPAATVPAPLHASAARDAAAQTLEMQISFTPAPADFKITAGSETILSGQGPATDFTGQAKITLPAEGADLALQVRWPDAATGHAAARLTVRFPDGHQIERTFFGDAGTPMVEVLTIGSKEP